MRYKGLDLNHLVTLDVLLSEQHLTRAALRLNLSQPAISNSLTKLREHFDDPLLIRRGREMYRSPFAEKLRKPLQATLQSIHEITSARPHFHADSAVRNYRIVASDYITAALMSPLILRLHELAPNVRIEQLYISDETIGRFTRGDADALIQPHKVSTLAMFPSRVLFSERYVCIAAQHNRNVGRTLTPEEFYAQPRAVPPYRNYIPDEHMAFAQAAEPAIPMPFANIPLFVSTTDHIAILPERLVQAFEGTLPIRRVQLSAPIPDVEFGIRWHSASLTDPFHSWMIEQISLAARPQARQRLHRADALVAIAS